MSENEYNLKYRFLTSNESGWTFASAVHTTSDVTTARINSNVDKVSTLDISIPNPYGVYTSGSGAVGNSAILEDMKCRFDVSLDGGLNYVTQFAGHIREKTSAEDNEGHKTIELTCLDKIDNRNIVNYNQGVLYRLRTNEIFQGTTLSENTWGTDTNGNYPNGLLYNSGLTYSSDSIVTRFTDQPADMAEYILPQRKLVECYNDMADWLGCHFFLKDGTSSELVFTPTFSAVSYTLSTGVSIGPNTLTFDTSDKVDGVLINGQNGYRYCQYQNTAPAHSDKVMVVTDDRISNPAEGMTRASSILNLYSASYVSSDLTSPGETGSYLGKTITVNNPDMGWAGLGNVLGMQKNFDADHFTTRWSFEKKNYNLPEEVELDLVDRIKELEENQNKENINEFYGYFKITSSEGSGHYGTQYFLGMGTNSTADTDNPKGLIHVISPIATLTQSSYTLSQYRLTTEEPWDYPYKRFTEFILFNTAETASKFVPNIGIEETKSTCLTRATNSSDWNGTSSEIELSTYVTKIERVYIDGMAVKWGDKGTDVGSELFWVTKSAFTLGTDYPAYTGSTWIAGENPHRVDFTDTLYSAIRNDELTPTSYTSITLSISNPDEDVPALFGKVSLPGRNFVQDTDFLLINCTGRTWSNIPDGGGSYTYFNAGPNLTFGYLPAANTWFGNRSFPPGANLPSGSWHHENWSLSAGDLSSFSTDTGEFYFTLVGPYGAETGSQIYMDIAYLEFYFHRGEPSFRLEKADSSGNNVTLTTQYPISEVKGIYTTSDMSGVNLLYKYKIGNDKQSFETEEPSIKYHVKYRTGLTGLHGKEAKSTWYQPLPMTTRYKWTETPFDKETIYIHYRPEKEYDDKYLTTYTEGKDFVLVRSPDGSAKDYIKWMMGTTSVNAPATASLACQSFPPYGSPVNVVYGHVGKDSSDGDVIRRWTSSTAHPGIFKNPYLDLAVDWEER